MILLDRNNTAVYLFGADKMPHTPESIFKALIYAPTGYTGQAECRCRKDRHVIGRRWNHPYNLVAKAFRKKEKSRRRLVLSQIPSLRCGVHRIVCMPGILPGTAV